MAADVFDATPAQNDAVTLQSLQDAFTAGSQAPIQPTDMSLESMAIDGAAIDASAPNGGYYSTMPGNGMGMGMGNGSDEYVVENGTIVSNSPMMEQTDETYQLADPTAPIMTYSEPVMTQPVIPAPVYGEPMMAVPTYSEPTYSEPMMAAPTYSEPMMAAPVYNEPIMAAPAYVEPAPVTISTVAQEPIVDHYASLAPTPLLPSGRDMAANGDGAYGPSVIKRAGEGPAGGEAALFVSKSTIVELPVDATEILVADPTRVRAVLRTARQLVLIGLLPGQTNITAFDEDGKQILNLDSNIRYDLRPLRRALASTFPGSQIEIESVLGEVIVKGTVSNAAEADAIRNLIRRYLYSASLGAGANISAEEVSFVDRLGASSDDQILVKVRIAEMRRSVIKQFGVDFNLASDSALGAAANGLTRSLTDFGSLTNAFGVNGAALGGIAANIAGSFGSTNFGALVRAFEQHSVMRVLAEPTLTAVSGETASFLAGGQFPYPTSVDDGDIGFTFRDFGVALEFTPVVVGDGRISLTVATEISELTTEGALSAGDISIPGISIRKANTTVELPSGGTMSIAGMLLQRDANAHTGLPGLKNLPVLGQLFSSTDYQKQETELVILVTPYIVKPGQEKEFRLPTDGFAPASDFDMFVLGRLEKLYGTGDTPQGSAHAASVKEALKAPFGFILE